ncbi:hypothetical protein AVEN_207378-1 [Araneus ventricosus]|uniref:Receptor ligand binding region domain-containing protein n=1 Tax=Araneus ventricosus TaxID=182803 RepID=A0A4Y2NG05_ARAVE|nr:hypothetical protein AVEN_207378-1 [Araneus ventricosus]
MICCNGRTFLLLLLPFAAAYRVKIGVVSGPGSDRRQNSEKFWSFGGNPLSSIVLEPTAYEISYWNTLEVIRTVCHAAQEGARALVVVQGPPRLASLLNTYSEHLHLPLVVDTPTPSTNPLQVSLLPDTVDATSALLRHYQWNSFAFIYDTDHAMECDRYGVSDRTATLFASAVLQDIGIVHEGEASQVVDRNKIRRQRKKL